MGMRRGLGEERYFERVIVGMKEEKRIFREV